MIDILHLTELATLLLTTFKEKVVHSDMYNLPDRMSYPACIHILECVVHSDRYCRSKTRYISELTSSSI